MRLSSVLIGLGLATSLFAAQNNNINPQEIERQIAEIQQLPLQERVAKMNEIKEELRHMNEQEREAIIREIAHIHHVENHEIDSNFKHNKYENGMHHGIEHMNDNTEHIEHDTEHMEHEVEHKEIEHHEIRDFDTDRVERNDRDTHEKDK